VQYSSAVLCLDLNGEIFFVCVSNIHTPLVARSLVQVFYLIFKIPINWKISSC
jgi:hypothetical protein